MKRYTRTLFAVMMTMQGLEPLTPAHVLQIVDTRSEAYGVMKTVMGTLHDLDYVASLARQPNKPRGWQNMMVRAYGRDHLVLVRVQSVEMVTDWDFLGPNPAQRVAATILGERPERKMEEILERHEVHIILPKGLHDM